MCLGVAIVNREGGAQMDRWEGSRCLFSLISFAVLSISSLESIFIRNARNRKFLLSVPRMIMLLTPSVMPLAAFKDLIAMLLQIQN